jgi:hypothetical protein
MRVPSWLSFLIAGLVIAFGLYRVRLALTAADVYAERRGRGAMYALPRRTHLVVGIVYLILGGWLVATAFGMPP